jgi:glycosyltransferase involved in cell wall biosynthesis
MTGTRSHLPAPLLLYEPRIEGHHLVWLKFIAEDLLSAGWPLVLAVDTRPASYERVQKRLGSLLQQTTVLSVYDESGQKTGGEGAGSVANCLERSGAGQVFLNTFDEIASSLLRQAALGRMPPASLQGKMGGIYIRPRFLARRGFSPNEWLKNRGFARLMRENWLKPLLFLDPWINEACQERFPQVHTFALPDPSPDDFQAESGPARQHFGISPDRKVFLFYGGAYRRKGLHLAVDAFLQLSKDNNAFLLCAGQQPDDPKVKQGLETLVHQGRAQVISRYIFEEEEKLLFAACDVVLLPYIRHFGNSAVLSRAAGAGKMVIASDEELVGRLVREHHLGLLFPSGDSTALRKTIMSAAQAAPDEQARWKAGALSFAHQSSRAEFRRVLLEAFGPPGKPSN